MMVHRQWSKLRLKVYPHTSYASGTPRRVSGQVIEAPDVVQASIHKEIGQAAGGFSLSLVPRQSYFEDILPNDWVELYLSNGTEDIETADPIMVGSIDRIGRRRVVGPNGATREVVTLNGRDYGKVFLNTTIIIDPLIGSIIDQATFEADVIISKLEENEVPLNTPPEVITALLSRYHDKRIQAVPPTSFARSLQKHFNEEIKGRIMVNGNPNLSGSLWSLMQQFINPVLNEFWVDTVHGEPTLFFEERPYGHDAFAKLESVQVSETEVSSEDFGKADDDTRNWVRVYADGQFIGNALVDTVGVGFINLHSAARSGLRKLDPTTIAFGELNRSVVDVLQEWSERLVEWNANNDQLLSGSMTTRLRPDARIGRRLDYTNRRTGEHLSFYIEGISHNFTYPGASTTTFTLTRGVTRSANALNFPLLRNINKLKRNGEVQQLSDRPAVGDFVAPSTVDGVLA